MLSESYDPAKGDALAIIDEISRAIIGTDDIGSVAYLILDLAIRHTDAEKGSLMLLDSRGQLYIHSSRGIDHEISRDYRLPLGEGIAGKIALEKQPVMVADLQTDPRFEHSRRDRYPTRSFVCCPIIGSEGVLGVLTINDKKNGQPFSEAEFRLIRALAAQAGLVLKNAFLMEGYKEKNAYAEEMSRKLIETDLAKTDFLTRLSHELRTPLNSIQGAVYFLKNTQQACDQGRDEFLRIIENEADRLTMVLEKQLGFLREENDRQVIRKTLVPVTQLLRQALDSPLVRNVLGQYQVGVEISPEALQPNIVGDRVQVNHLFINILVGLAGQLEKGRKIRIQVTEREAVRVEFRCDQILSPPVVEGFFRFRDDYGQGDSDPAVKLYLGRKVAEANGWQLEARNDEQGLLCRLLIPRVAAEMEDAALDMTMGRILEFVSGMLGASTSSLMLRDELSGDLVVRSARGLDEEVVRGTRLRVGERVAGWVAAEGRPLLVEDMDEDPRFGRLCGSLRYSSRSLLSVPVKNRDRVIGVLNLTDKQDNRTFSARDLKVAQVVVERITTFIQTLKKMSGQSHRDLHKIVASLDSLLAAEVRYTKRNVCYLELVEALMQALQADQKDQELALYAALIYDLGLVLHDRRLLEKKHRLSPLEITALQSHPFTTLELLQDFDGSEEVRQIILHHHENYDGSGYPDGLAGEDIPLISRVLAVVDSYCAMREERPYRPARSRQEALDALRQGSGTRYDPLIVAQFETLVQRAQVAAD